MRTFAWRFLAVVLVTLGVLMVTGVGSTGHTAEKKLARPVYAPVVGSTADPTVAEVEAAWAAWSHDQVAQAIMRYVEAVNFAEWLAALPPPPPPPAPVYQAPPQQQQSSQAQAHSYQAAPAPTGACGGATNGADQFIQRESRGNPGIYNSGGSGAWGCYQIMPGTWAGSGCDQFGSFGSATPAEQAQCASKIPLSAWNE